MRAVLALLGAVTLALAWLGPSPTLRRAFSVHMGLHVAVVAVAAPLLALAIAGSRLDPVRRAPAWLPPIPVSLVEFAVVWTWHAPAPHHAAQHHAGWWALEQASFLLSGTLLWIAAFGGRGPQRSERAAAGVVALLLTSMHMTLLGALLALAPRPLYPSCGAYPGLSALQDQHLGGAIMLLVGGAVYLLGGVVLTASVLRRAPATEGA
jgi:putative membrane protein